MYRKWYPNREKSKGRRGGSFIILIVLMKAGKLSHGKSVSREGGGLTIELKMGNINRTCCEIHVNETFSNIGNGCKQETTARGTVCGKAARVRICGEMVR